MRPHIMLHERKAVVRDAGIGEKVSVSHDDQSPLCAGERNVETRLLLQESDAPPAATADSRVDDDITLAALKRVHRVDVRLDMGERRLLEAVSNEFQLGTIRGDDADGIGFSADGDFLIEPLQKLLDDGDLQRVDKSFAVVSGRLFETAPSGFRGGQPGNGTAVEHRQFDAPFRFGYTVLHLAVVEKMADQISDAGVHTVLGGERFFAVEIGRASCRERV